MHLFLLFACFFGKPSFQLIETIPLSVDPVTIPVIKVASDGAYWFSDCHDDWVVKLADNGDLLFKIDGSGQGPWAFKSPCTLIPLGDSLLVKGKHGALTRFSEKTGEFDGQITRFLPAFSHLRWDDQHYMVVLGIVPEGMGALAGADIRKAAAKGNVFLFPVDGNAPVQTWKFDLPEQDASLPWVSVCSTTKSAAGTIYMAEGTYPVIWVFDLVKESMENWRIKPPSGYVIPPEKGLDAKYRFNALKVDAFYNGFTTIRAIQVIAEKYLVVQWQGASGRPNSLDLYSLPDRKLLIRDFTVKGRLVDVKGSNLYMFDDEGEAVSDSYSERDDPAYQIQIWKFRPKGGNG